MRLFVAIDIPDMVKEHLSFLQRSLERDGLRLVHPKNIHLTLNFLGEQQDVEHIIARLKTLAFEQFSLRLATPGCFPDNDDPRVVWVGLDASAALADLQRRIDLLFTPQKSFKAHLTLARIKNLSFQEKVLLVRDIERLPVRPLSFKVASFKLYKSTLTPLGPVYEVLEVFKGS